MNLNNILLFYHSIDSECFFLQTQPGPNPLFKHIKQTTQFCIDNILGMRSDFFLAYNYLLFIN